MQRLTNWAAVALLFLGGPCRAGATPGATDPPRVIVGSDAGLQEVGLDGRVLRTLTKTPARFPRYLPPTRRALLFLVPQGKGAYAPYRELRRFSLDDRREEVVARFPELLVRCGKTISSSASIDALLVQDENYGFVVSPGAACLDLLDRNSNLATTQVSLRVDLRRERVAQRILALGSNCRIGRAHTALGDAQGFRCGDLPRQHRLAGASPTPAPSSARYRLLRGRLLRVDGRRVVSVAWMSSVFVEDPFTETNVLPRRDRWAVVKGNHQMADYLHYNLLVLDRETGNLYPVLTGAWPTPITPQRLRAWRPLELFRATRDVVGEEAIHWLGVGSGFHVGRTLVVPGSHTVQLPGDPAE